MIDWTRIDLEDDSQRNLNFLDPYDFDTFLLEVSCNIPDGKLTSKRMLSHGREVLRAKYIEALEILEDNIENLLSYEQSKREQNAIR